MLNLRRLQGTLVALVALIIVLCSCGFLLSGVAGLAPGALLGKYRLFYTLYSYNEVGAQISGALQHPPAADSRMGLLLGASTLECGVAPQALKVGAAKSWQWLSLYGKGGTLVDLKGMTDIWLRSPVPADLFVLMINLGGLARPDQYPSDAHENDAVFESKSFSAHLTDRQWSLVGEDVRNLFVSVPNWIFPFRLRLSNRFQYTTLISRMTVLSSLGSGIYAAFRPDSNPWKVEQPYFTQGAHPQEEFLSIQQTNFRELGWFDQKCYQANNENTKSLVELVTKVRARKTPVIVLMMPESSRIHKLVPQKAERVMRTALEQAFGSDAPEVIDLRESMPDRLFYDLTHLDGEGRKQFTRLLSQVLTSHLPAR